MKNKTLRKFLLTASIMSGLALGHSAWAENLIYHQGWPYEWLGKAERYDHMGSALAMGDFNNDGYADIAVGIPFESINVNGLNAPASGAVNVLYGSPTGPKQYDEDTYTLLTFNALYKAQPINYFGNSLAIGDFNCDGFDDLVIGATNYGPDDDDSYGAIFMLYGHSGGLNTTTKSSFRQDQVSNDPQEMGDRFGEELLAKDFTGDGCDDLAVGVPGEDLENGPNVIPTYNAGVVHVLYGHKTGLNSPSALKSKLISQNDLSQGDGAKKGDSFGSSLASGDFNNDGYNDLAIGAYGEDGTIANVGYINILKGSLGGIITSGDIGYSQQNLSYTISKPKDYYYGENFGGFSLASGNLDGKYGDDLLIITPDDHWLEPIFDEAVFQGSVTQLKSNGTDLSKNANVFLGGGADGGFPLRQIDAGMVVGNFNGDSYDDVVFIRGHSELVFEFGNSLNGAFGSSEYYGDEDGYWSNGGFKFKYGVDEGKSPIYFYTVAAGDINGDGLDDIVVGSPETTIGSGDAAIENAGAIGVWLNPN